MPRIKITTARLIGAAFVAAVTSAAIVGSTGTANAIANGTPVPDGQYSFSTKLTMTGIPNPDGTTRDSACSGALIAPLWIVTAGHCFHDVNGNRVSGPTPYTTTATVGRTDLSSTSGHVVNVDKVWQAPRGDVALGRLASPVTDITPLPMAAAAPKAGAILRMTGWGATSSVNPVPVTHLMTGQVKVKRVNGTSVLVVGYAPSRKTSACVWDSGAPYFSESSGGTAALVSVESDGPACPHSQEETTTRIDRNADWIRQTIAQSTPIPIRGV
jgi:secreted trypsin-like serine protease